MSGREGWLKSKLELLVVIVGFMTMRAAGATGWRDQQNKTEILAREVERIDDAGSKITQLHTLSIALIEQQLSQIKEAQRQMRDENLQAHAEIKAMLKDRNI